MADTPFVSLYRRFRPGRFDEIGDRTTSCGRCAAPCATTGCRTPTSSAVPAVPGKTSSARILAKALNCETPVDGEPCGICTSCVEITQGSSLNVHELDAALEQRRRRHA